MSVQLVVEQCFEIRHMAEIGVVTVLGRLTFAKAHVIRHDHAPVLFQPRDEVAIQVSPGRLAMHANDRMRGVTDHHWFNWVQTAEFEPTVSNLGATALSVIKRIGFERTGHVDETWIRAYASPFPTPESCRGALQFPRNIANPDTFAFFAELAEQHDVEALRALPAMCIHGEEDRAIPFESAVAAFKDFWPAGPVVTLPGVGHFLQEDAPEAVSSMVEMFMQINS